MALRWRYLPVVVAMSLAAAPIVPAPRSGPPIPGYLDIRTGVFTPVSVPSAAPASTPITLEGTLDVVAKVRIDPTIPAGTTLSASISAFVTDPATTTGVYYNSGVSASGTLTRTGNVGTITFTLPYDVVVASAADTFGIYFTVSAYGSANNYVSFSQSIPLPASGKTTKLAIGNAI